MVYTESETNLAGTIYKQSREAGSPVRENATFKIYVYKAVEEQSEEPGETCEDGLC